MEDWVLACSDILMGYQTNKPTSKTCEEKLYSGNIRVCCLRWGFPFQVKIRPEGWETRNDKPGVGVNGAPEFNNWYRHIRIGGQNNNKASDAGADAKNTETKRDIQAKLFFPIESENTHDRKRQNKDDDVGGEVEGPGDVPDNELTPNATVQKAKPLRLDRETNQEHEQDSSNVCHTAVDRGYP